MKEIVSLALLSVLARFLYTFGKKVRETALVRMKLHNPQAFDRYMDRRVQTEWMQTDFLAIADAPKTAAPQVLVTRWLNPTGGDDLILPGVYTTTRARAEKFFPPPALLIAKQEWMTREAFNNLPVMEEAR